MCIPRDYAAAGSATLSATTYYGLHMWEKRNGSGGGISNPENWSSLIGIVTAIVGNVLISFALNIQRYAHIRLEREWQEKERGRKRRSAAPGMRGGGGKYHPPRGTETLREEREGEDGVAGETDPLIPRPAIRQRESGDIGRGQEEGAYKQQSYLKSGYWWAGIILMTTGEAGNFLAYGFAPASIVSPLGVVALVSNCIIAPIVLKERFRTRDGLGVLVAVAGAVTVVLSANDNNPKLGPQEIWDLITRWEFETYLGITIAVICVLMWCSNRYGEKNILIDLGLVGLFGGYTALSTKGVASMLSYTLWRAITFPVTYLLVVILVSTAIMQIKYINRALQRFDATQVIPVQFVMFTLSVILGSAILYRDFERTSGGDAGKFVGGCAMTFLGVWMITSGRPRRIEEDEDDWERDPEPEDAINLVGERYEDETDGINTPTGPSSRRPSAMRAMSPPISITTKMLPRDPARPSTPDITLTPSDTVLQTPRTPSIPSSLTNNPWDAEPPPSASPSLRPRPKTPNRNATLSTPVLPSEATAIPPPASQSNPELAATNPPLPHTPTRNASENNVPTPTTGTLNRLRRMGTAERLGLVAGGRNSIPGPLLASPLSNSLSAMITDLKRGNSLRGSGAHTVMGIGAGEMDGGAMGTGEDGFGEPLDRRRTANEEGERRQELRGRGRSLSGTLGDLWRGITGGDGAEEDVERVERS
ncbi:DUF803-domain-containing protein [Amniculicola lignicola CBS 123094]|uniref:DUF803-domain-containing protein n=1 Tax=Amniculicola lignicola CBS 123094 TaxID=1392246 RepID=A0A6A5WU75_9PLEO|nr:DUF803-domain-containing protein [Amniculicola lignicola CBS 123094]